MGEKSSKCGETRNVHTILIAKPQRRKPRRELKNVDWKI
jgi:hypothetical protein